ncbi:transposable element Tc1 transposase, partial [Choiromyces venosus 120613-1]
KIIKDNVKTHGVRPNQEISLAFGIQKLPLPACSPDLNLIENNIDEQPHCEDQLWEVIEEEWEAIDQTKIDRLVDSMPFRLQTVIDAGGSYIKW